MGVDHFAGTMKTRSGDRFSVIPAFTRFIGIDYSGAETPRSALKGLRVYLAEGRGQPVEVLPPPLAGKYWSRRGIAEWLVERLAEDVPTLTGIDHGFSFPLRYFKEHGLPLDWPCFLDDFRRHWPTDEDHTYVDFVRDGVAGDGARRMGNTRWRRLTDQRAGGAKSVFHFDVPGQVAKSTHAGIPWLHFIHQRSGEHVHFWPFDGWDVLARRSVIAEVYPALWSHGFARQDRTGDQHDAFSIAAWLSRADHDGSLAAVLKPGLSPLERTIAQVEGWILGVEANGSPKGGPKPKTGGSQYREERIRRRPPCPAISTKTARRFFAPLVFRGMTTISASISCLAANAVTRMGRMVRTYGCAAAPHARAGRPALTLKAHSCRRDDLLSCHAKTGLLPDSYITHSTGNGSLALVFVRPSGRRPTRTASTISGPNSVKRRTRLT